jgi:hypothetical protein
METQRLGMELRPPFCVSCGLKLTMHIVPLPTPILIPLSIGSCKVRIVLVSCCRIASRMSAIGSLEFPVGFSRIPTNWEYFQIVVRQEDGLSWVIDIYLV